jgi:metal-responsive CopG/Arc/MetJ family transcriptional regulator
MSHENLVAISVSIPLSLVQKIDTLEGKSRSAKMRQALKAGYAELEQHEKKTTQK